MAVNPGPLRTRKRAAAMPGEDKMTLRVPEELAPKNIEMCAPGWGVTGAIYDFPSDQMMRFKGPE